MEDRRSLNSYKLNKNTAVNLDQITLTDNQNTNLDGIQNFKLNSLNYEQNKLNQRFVDDQLEEDYYASALIINFKKCIYFCIFSLVFFIALIFNCYYYYDNRVLFEATIVISIMVVLVDCMLFLPYTSRNYKLFLKLVVIFSGFGTNLIGIFTWNKEKGALLLIRFADIHILFLLITSVLFLEFNYALQFLLCVAQIGTIIILDIVINGTVTTSFIHEILYIIILYIFCTVCIEKEKEDYSRSLFIKKKKAETFYKYVNSLLDGMNNGVISIKLNNSTSKQDIIYKNRAYDDILSELELYKKINPVGNHQEDAILLDIEGSSSQKCSNILESKFIMITK